MAALRLYTDENVTSAIADGLRRRGIDAWTTAQAGRLGASDDEQLTYAADQHAALFTHDTDLIVIARRWQQQSKTHWGVIYVHQDKLGTGECIRRSREYADVLEAEDMKDQVEFL